MSAVRVPELDGIRGIAVIMVVVFHTMLLVAHKISPLHALTSWMWTGVDIFLVLSGYLITQILLRSYGGKQYFLNFFLRRLFRIFPAYYVTLILIFALVPHLSQEFALSGERGDLWLYVAYLQNWKFAINGWPEWHGLAHLWSVAVEEQFYLLWPLVFLLTGARWIREICLAVFGVAIATKLVAILSGAPPVFNLTSTVTRMDAIAAGALIATLPPERLYVCRGWLWAVAITAGLSLSAHVLFKPLGGAKGAMMVSLSVVALAAATMGLLRAGVAMVWLRRMLSLRLLMRIGVHSYSIYLLHYPLQLLIYEHFGTSLRGFVGAYPVAACLVLVPLSLLLCWLAALPLHYFVESPGMRLRRYFQEPAGGDSFYDTAPDTTVGDKSMAIKSLAR